jgi:hypothetical protein
MSSNKEHEDAVHKSVSMYHGLKKPNFRPDNADPELPGAEELLDPQLLKYKDGNPKTTLGQHKPGTFKTPPIPLYLYSLAHLQGALKYGHYNWRDDPISISTYADAAKRHIDLFVEGQKNASDTGIHNLAHAMTCLSILIDAEFHGCLIDDRKGYREEKGIALTAIPEPVKSREEAIAVLEKFWEEFKILQKRIYEQWQGHAEKHYGNEG